MINDLCKEDHHFCGSSIMRAKNSNKDGFSSIMPQKKIANSANSIKSKNALPDHAHEFADDVAANNVSKDMCCQAAIQKTLATPINNVEITATQCSQSMN